VGSLPAVLKEEDAQFFQKKSTKTVGKPSVGKGKEGGTAQAMKRSPLDSRIIPLWTKKKKKKRVRFKYEEISHARRDGRAFGGKGTNHRREPDGGKKKFWRYP